MEPLAPIQTNTLPKELSQQEVSLFGDIHEAVDKSRELDRREVFQRMLGQVALERTITGADSVIDGNASELRKITPYNRTLESVDGVTEEQKSSFKIAIKANTDANPRVEAKTIREKFTARRLDRKLAKHDRLVEKERKEHLRSGLMPDRIRIHSTNKNIRKAHRDINKQYRRGEIDANKRDKLKAEAVVKGTERRVNSTYLRKRQKAVNRSSRSLERFAARRGASVDFDGETRLDPYKRGRDAVYKNHPDHDTRHYPTDLAERAFDISRESASVVAAKRANKIKPLRHKKAKQAAKREKAISKLQKIAENDNAAALAREAEEDEA